MKHSILFLLASVCIAQSATAMFNPNAGAKRPADDGGNQAIQPFALPQAAPAQQFVFPAVALQANEWVSSDEEMRAVYHDVNEMTQAVNQIPRADILEDERNLDDRQHTQVKKSLGNEALSLAAIAKQAKTLVRDGDRTWEMGALLVTLALRFNNLIIGNRTGYSPQNQRMARRQLEQVKDLVNDFPNIAGQLKQQLEEQKEEIELAQLLQRGI